MCTVLSGVKECLKSITDCISDQTWSCRENAGFPILTMHINFGSTRLCCSR